MGGLLPFIFSLLIIVSATARAANDRARVSLPTAGKSAQRGDAAASVDSCRQAFAAWPATAPPTQAYLEAALDLVVACQQAQLWDEAEQVASRALVRATALADSCLEPALLFSRLATCYEQRGDSIMPRHLHRKSQVLSLRHAVLTQHADSFDIYCKRMDEWFKQMENVRKQYGEASAEYMDALSGLAVTLQVNGENTREALLVGEQALDVARRGGLLQDNRQGVAFALSDVYTLLLYCYAALDLSGRGEALWPVALDYHHRHPELDVPDAYLYYMVGCGHAAAQRTAVALEWLRRARKACNSKTDPAVRAAITGTIDDLEGGRP